MFVDDNILAEIAAGYGLQASSLQDVVRRKLGHSKNIFRTLKVQTARWRDNNSGEAPPSLPLLALSVLAASRMVRDGEFSSHNYYGRLEPILSIPKQCLSAEFDDVAGMWRDLDEWLGRQGGRRGTSTISSHSRLTKIGYPLSQALLRESDRRSLTRFFRWAGVDRRSLTGAELVSAIKVWGQGRAGLSPAFRKMITSPPDVELLEGLLEIESHGWDGQVRDQDGRVQLRLRLLLRPVTQDLAWVAETPGGLAVDDEAQTAWPIRFELDLSGRFLRSRNAKPEPEDVAGGVTWKASKVCFKVPRRLVLPMLREPVLGGWLSSEEIAQDAEEQLLLVHRSVWSSVLSFLQSVLGSVPEPIRGDIFPGYQLLRLPPLRLAPSPAIHGALPPSIAQVWPEGSRGGARFSGGLPLRPGSGMRTYLAGGAPDLLLTTSKGGSRLVQASLNGEATAVPASGLPLPLEGIVSGPGEYDLVADGAALRFRVVEGSGLLASPAVGGVGWSVRARAAAWQPEEAGAAVPGICGALAPSPQQCDERAIQTEGCASIHLFGDLPGEVQEIDIAEQTAHGDLFGGGRPKFIEVKLQFAPTWIVRNWAGRKERPKARAKLVELAGATRQRRPNDRALREHWRSELKRLESASNDMRWRQLTLKAWWS